MWLMMAMCCCLPLCAYMYMRSRRQSQMHDGFNRVGGRRFYGDGYDSDDGRPPPGTRYIVVQRGQVPNGAFQGSGV